jgi:hypothetical protein
MRVSTRGWRSASFDENPTHRLSAVGRLKIAVGGSDDGALRRDVPRTGEVIGIDQAGRFGMVSVGRSWEQDTSPHRPFVEWPTTVADGDRAPL